MPDARGTFVMGQTAGSWHASTRGDTNPCEPVPSDGIAKHLPWRTPGRTAWAMDPQGRKGGGGKEVDGRVCDPFQLRSRNPVVIPVTPGDPLVQGLLKASKPGSQQACL